MGLDAYLARISNAGQRLDWLDEVPSGLTAEDLALFGALDLPLCEWVVDRDSVSFRGKAPAIVATMAQRFAEADPRATVAALNADHPGYRSQPLSLEEFSGLGLLFETCAAAGLGFANDW